MRIRCLAVWLLFLAMCSARAESNFHIFTDTVGRSLEATVIRYDEAKKTVTIKPKDRPATTVSISIFSAEDQTFIVEWSKSHAFLDENKLRADIKRIKKKNTSDSREGYDSATIAYDNTFKLVLENRSKTDLKNITLEYVVFYSQDFWTNNRHDVESKNGTLYAKSTISIPAKSKKEIDTQTLTLHTYRESGFSGESYWADRDFDVKGIILKLSIKTKDGETISREIRYPDKLEFQWTTKTSNAQ